MRCLPFAISLAFVTQREAGQGVAKLIDELIADDLTRIEGKLEQHFITIGLRADGSAVAVPPYGVNILIAGPSGDGKSTVVTGIVERLIKQNYQSALLIPRAITDRSEGVITLGDRDHAVGINEVLSILEDPKINLNVNLLGIPLLNPISKHYLTRQSLVAQADLNIGRSSSHDGRQIA
jgi:hypothetical protein